MKSESLKDIYIEELKDIYHAENSILKALPGMIKAASNQQLKDAFQEHLEETRVQVERLNQIFEHLGVASRGKKCEGMVGILAEGESYLKKDIDPSVKDAALIASAQKVEHYEMASYGTLKTFAHLLGEEDVAGMLEETLKEEKQADQKLTRIAERSVNRESYERTIG